MVRVGSKLKVTLYVVLIFIFFWWGRDFFPTSREITEIQATQVLGVDLEADGKVTISIVVDDKKVDNSKSSSKSNGKQEKVITVTADTFSGTIEGLQNYNDKVFIGGHVKNIVIGEEMAREELIRVIDFLTKDKEVRFNVNVFIAKGSSAKDLLTNSLSEDYKVVDKLSNLVLTSKGDKTDEHTELIDVMNILISDEKNGMIPAAKVVRDNEYNREFAISVSDDNKERDEFAGYGIVKDAKLIDFMDTEESAGYDYINNKTVKMPINIQMNGEVISMNVNNLKTDVNFNFEGETLREIIIKTNLKSTITEASSGENIFKERLGEVEDIAAEKVKTQILKTTAKSQSEGIDFIGINKVCEMKHPYKWHNIKENWEEIFSSVPVTVEAKVKINRTYDTLGIIKEDVDGG